MKKNNSFLDRLFMALVFVFLYAPIVLLIVFSFNSGNSNMVWKGFSLHWYTKLFRNRIIMQSVYTTLLVSLLATIIATVAGTFAAIGFYAMRRRVRNPLMTVNNIPMMNADIVSGALTAFTMSIDDFVISYFTAGSSSSTLAMTIYGMTKKKVTPEINAISTLLFVTVLVLLAVINVREARQERKLAAEQRR